MSRSATSQHDSPLGRWTRALYFPDAPLAAHVDMFWFVAGRADFARDRRLPTGRTHLLFNLGSPALLFERDADAAVREFPACWLAGQHDTYIETGSRGDTVLLGAQFASHGAYRLLRIAQHELCGRVIGLEALLGDQVGRLHQRLLDAATPDACFALLERWLLDLLECGKPVHADVIAAEHAARANPGALRIGALSRTLGVSEAHLIRMFRAQVGLTPKAYAGILRFDRALRQARRARASWASIAADCGYFDQAHLANAFQRYAGRTPTSLLLDRMPDADSIVVG
ncbi:MAG: AraC family transcriptional regulator [Rudaea sp.]